MLGKIWKPQSVLTDHRQILCLSGLRSITRQLYVKRKQNVDRIEGNLGWLGTAGSCTSRVHLTGQVVQRGWCCRVTPTAAFGLLVAKHRLAKLKLVRAPRGLYGPDVYLEIGDRFWSRYARRASRQGVVEWMCLLGLGYSLQQLNRQVALIVYEGQKKIFVL